MAHTSGLRRVDFEIAFTALLATAVTTYSSSNIGFYPVVRLLAIGLLVPTLFRRIAIRKSISGNLPSIMWTTYTMDVFSYISVMYLLYVFSTWLKAYSGISISVPFLFGIFTPLFSIGLLVVQELTIKDALKEAQRIFQTQSIEYGGSAFGAYLSRIAQISGSRRVDLKHSNSQQSELRDFTRSKSLEDLNEEEVWILVKSAYVFLGSATGVLITYFIFFVVGIYLWNIRWYVALLLLISTLSVSGLVGLWFSNYGVVQVEDRNGYYHLFTIIFSYFFIGYLRF